MTETVIASIRCRHLDRGRPCGKEVARLVRVDGALVVRNERDGIRRYVHVGTGNYHPTTARQYEDLGLLTADPVLAADVSHLFNRLTGYSRRSAYDALIVAPTDMRDRIVRIVRIDQLGQSFR